MTENDWIMEVLGDIISFSKKNGLPKIAEILLDAEIIAYAELLSKNGNVKYLHSTNLHPRRKNL